MYTRIDRPAQMNRGRCVSTRELFFPRVSLILSLILLLAGLPVRPASAQQAGGPDQAINPANKITVPTGVSDGTLLWGDYDNDGDLDILASGVEVDNTGRTVIFVNNEGSFSQRSSGMEQVQFSSADWGDYDNDGYLDVLLTGQLRVEGGSNVIGFAGLYHNVEANGARTFTLQQTFDNIYQGSGTFGDYNNDGRQDILLTGYTNNGVPYSRLWRNTGNFSGNVFSSSGTPGVTALGNSAAAWGDVNRDGLLDFAISGMTADNRPATYLYRNRDGSSFATITLTGLWGGTVNFLDHNHDRYLDLLVTGNAGTNQSPGIQPRTILYQYYTSAPNFREVPSTGLPDVWTSSVSVGDYNNDGYPDLAIGGKTLTTLPNQVYTNQGNGTFTNAGLALPDGAGTMFAWGDYNGDNAIDLSLTGIHDFSSGQEIIYTYIYPNSLSTPNAPPSAPTMEAACWNDTNSRLTLVWKNSIDTPTNTNTLSYNIRVGTTPGGQDVVSPFSDADSGYHRLPAIGFSRAGMPGTLPNPPALPSGTVRYTSVLINPPADDYYWSVQAIDTSYVGGPFDPTPGRVINLGTAIANNDMFTVLDSGNNVPLNVLANDNGGGSPLAVYSFSNPTHGTLTRDTSNPNLLIYNPTEPYQGTDTFNYYAQRTNSLYCTRASVTITVNQQNDSPSDITLDNTLVPEGALPGTLVGNLETTDPDAGQSFTYSLPAGGAADNARFTITGNQLYTSTLLNTSPTGLYYIRVRSTDQGNLFVEKNFTIQVVGNQPPIDISLSATSVVERQNVGTQIGTLSTTDPDENDKVFTYSLVSFEGNAYDNASFSIVVDASGSHLATNAMFDYNARSSYQVRIRSTDRGGKFTEKIFAISVLPSTPSFNTNPIFPIQMSEDGTDSYGNTDSFHLTLSAIDIGVGEQLTWSISRQAANGTAATAPGTTTTTQSKQITYTPASNWNSADARGNDSFVVRVTDLGGHYAEKEVTVTVKAVNDPPQFSAVPARTVVERSGLVTVPISGIVPGPLYETGQRVTLAAQCPFGEECPFSDFAASPVAADGTGAIYFRVGYGTGTYTVVVVARDDQALNNTYSVSFPVTIITGKYLYLPVIQK